MSTPYVYSPDPSYQPGPYGLNSAPGTPYSPFIPPAAPFPPSPYAQPVFIPISPHMGSSPLPNVNPAVDPSTFYRQRRPSWHGSSPLLSPQGLFPPQQHHRSRSFGADGQAPFFPTSPSVGFVPTTPPSGPAVFLPAVMTPAWAAPSYIPWGQPQPAAPEPKQTIHPLLNGENPQSNFFFNIANPMFAPCRVVGANGETTPITAEELSQPACHPPIYDLKVVSDKLPSKWAIEIAYQPQHPYYPGAPAPTSPNPAGKPPITVGDVLLQIHRALHLMITRPDWNVLDSGEEGKVTKAFFKRCAAAGPGQRDWFISQGVKRVDYLLEKIAFRGLVRTGRTFNEMKLVTSKP